MNFPRTPSFHLNGRRAVVTGDCWGIGLGAAVALAEAGAAVKLAVRGAEALGRVARQMAAGGLCPALFLLYFF